jgi:hypothetical protein
MIRSAAARLLLSLLALVPAPALAYPTLSLDGPVSSADLRLELAAPARVDADPFGPLPRISLGPLSLNGRPFEGERGFGIRKYANSNPTRYIDPDGHQALLSLA